MKWVYRNDTGKEVSHNSKRWGPGEINSVPFSVPEEKGLTLLKFDSSVKDRFAGGSLVLGGSAKKTFIIPDCNSFQVSILCFSGGANVRFNGDDGMPPAHLRAGVRYSGQYSRANAGSIDIQADSSGADLEILIERVN